MNPTTFSPEVVAAFAKLNEECKARAARERGLLAIRNNLIDQGNMRAADSINRLP